jgi:hypothetical protein
MLSRPPIPVDGRIAKRYWNTIIIARIVFSVSDGVATLLCEWSLGRSSGVGDSSARGEQAEQFQNYSPARILPPHEVLGFSQHLIWMDAAVEAP